MYLGLDLRGGVHFLMQVDTKAVLNKRSQGLPTSVRAPARQEHAPRRHRRATATSVEINFREQETAHKARDVLASQCASCMVLTRHGGDGD